MSTPVVLITGALAGIGRATALAFAHEGVSGRSDEIGQALATELRDLGAEAEYVHADVRARTTCATWSIGPSRALVAWT